MLNYTQFLFLELLTLKPSKRPRYTPAGIVFLFICLAVINIACIHPNTKLPESERNNNKTSINKPPLLNPLRKDYNEIRRRVELVLF